jgi:hypothetical protein
MEHLAELCCDACREKVEQIERRTYGSNDTDAKAVDDAFADRRELLTMLEVSLMTLTKRRDQFRQGSELARKAGEMLAKGVTEMHQEVSVHREALQWALEHGPKMDRHGMLYNRTTGETIEPPAHLRATFEILFAMSLVPKS